MIAKNCNQSTSERSGESPGAAAPIAERAPISSPAGHPAVLARGSRAFSLIGTPFICQERSFDGRCPSHSPFSNSLSKGGLERLCPSNASLPGRFVGLCRANWYKEDFLE